MKFALSFFAICCLLYSMNSCNKKEPDYPNPQPEPEPELLFACANSKDIYHVWPDTFFVNSDGKMYVTYEDKVADVSAGSQFALGTCEGKTLLRGEPLNSPLAVMVRTEEGKDKARIPVSSGNIYMQDVIAEEDLARVVKLHAGAKVNFEMAMTNANQDTIQSNTLTIIFEPDFQKP